MKKKHSLLLIISLFSLFAQAKITISGFVSDSKTQEVLIGAYVINLETGTGTTTNNYGYYSLVCENEAILQFSYVGYQKHTQTIATKSDTIINIALSESNSIDEVVVKAQKRSSFNTSTLSIKELNSIPSLGAKPDVVKTMQLLPGIQGQSEGSSLLIVRGGNPGDNLFLLDKVPLIYVNHLGGFFSVFNPDMINSISVYKGGFPAEYGGKISSVVDISQRRGNADSLKGTFSIGLTDASLTLEGRLGKKATFILAGRKTMIDPLFYGLTSALKDNEFRMFYGFHDVNAKFSWQPNAKNSLFFNVYQGDDYLYHESKQGHYAIDEETRSINIWGNSLASAGWNYTASPKVLLENNISYTRYRLKDKQSISDTSEFDKISQYLSSVEDASLRSVINYQLLKWWNMKAGVQPSLYIHTPYSFYYTANDTIRDISQVLAGQTATFIENKIKFLKNSEVNLGGRYVNYFASDFQHSWFEPRFNLIAGINANNKINLSYMQVKQNTHLLHSSGAIMNNEVWIPATKEIPLAESWQGTIGWMSSFVDNMYSTEVNLYYKEMCNLATYKEGFVNLKGDVDWAQRIETGGKGLSYGLEFMLKKEYGDWTGSLSYTWSKTTRQFDEINNGKEYTYEYDRPHSLSLMINHKLGKKWDFNLTWVYQTGLPYTPVLGRHYTPSLNLDYQNDNIWDFDPTGEEFYYEALIYGKRNSARMSDYHRLDIGFNYTTTTKKLKRKAIWSFSVYNMYNRQNPSYYYYNNNETGEIHRPELNNGFKPLSMYQMSLFPIIPSVSYKLFFHKGDNKKPFIKRFEGLLFYD